VAIIDRDRELGLVESFLADAGRGVRALVFRGEPGIGKTALWEAAVEAAAGRGYRVVTTRPTEAEARIPFAGLNDLLGELMDAELPDLPPPQQRALDVALQRADADGEPMPRLALSLAALELLRLASADKPLALAIDDVPWLDESSAGILMFALRRLEREPVIVLTTERVRSGSPAPGLLADIPTGSVHDVPVEGLPMEAIDRLFGDVFGLHLAPTMLRRVQRMSNGNPLHAMEIGRAFQELGDDGGVPLVPLPASLAGLLRQRLAALAPAAREAVTCAAALSHPTLSLLTVVMGAERAHAGLAGARAADVIAPGDEAIRFAHPLFATEVYAGLGDEDRRDLHRRLADVVTEPEELARHLALGATGPDAAVAAALDAAATHALGRGAPDAAAELSELAANLTPAADPVRARRMAAAGRHRLMAGDVVRARELLERTLAEPAAASGVARAEVLFRLAGVRQLMDDFAASAALGREALEHAGDDTALTVQIKLLLAGNSFITGQEWTSGSLHAAEAMALAEQLEQPRILAATIGACLTWCYATGNGYRRDLAQRATELEPWTDRLRTLDLPVYDVAVIELAEGETSAAYERLRGLLDRAERDGDYSSLPFLLANVSLGDFLDGRRDAALERIDRAARLAEATDQRVARVHTLSYEARLAARLGDADRALTAGRAAFELMATTGWRVGEWWMRADLALLKLGRGDAVAALELVGGALAPPGADEPPRKRSAQSVAVEALLALGRHDDARRVLDELDAHVLSVKGSPRLLADARRVRARLLAADGDVEGAGTAIGEAEAIHRRMDDRWELARTLLVAGEIHRRARRRAMARTALREAVETFTFLGARAWASVARDQLARIDAARADGGLTPTQLEVARLVASGLANRQVAHRLAMSGHTVEAHLSAIYRSLGIRSRTELAGALSRLPVRDSSAESRDSATS
jgi:DNA-binding CsgD family transcriptional regulator